MSLQPIPHCSFTVMPATTIRRLFGLLLPALLLATATSCRSSPATYHCDAALGTTAKISYGRRDYSSGRMNDFSVQDRATIQKIVELLRKAPEVVHMRGSSTTTSVDYEITCYDDQGKQIGNMIPILGGKAAVQGDRWFSMTEVIAELDRSVSPPAPQ